MTTTGRQLEIRRIYSASPTRAAATIRTQARAGPRLRFSALGPLSLLVAAAWTFVVWFPADRLILTNVMRTGLAHLSDLSGGEVSFADFLGTAPDDLADPTPPADSEETVPPAAAHDSGAAPEAAGPTDEERAEREAQSTRLLVRLNIDKWVWLIVTTFTACWLAMSGAASVAGAQVTDPARRRQLLMGASILMLLAAVVGVRLWHGKPLPGLPKPAGEITFVAFAALAVYALALALRPWLAGVAAVLLGLVAVCVGGAAFYDWWSGSLGLVEVYPLFAARMAPVVLLVVAGLAGAAMARRAVGLHRAGVVLILVATVVTLGGLKYAESIGGVHTHVLTAGDYGKLAIAQSAYAWVLIGALALRLR